MANVTFVGTIAEVRDGHRLLGVMPRVDVEPFLKSHGYRGYHWSSLSNVGEVSF